jgi:type I restriction enzyme, R subunit
VRDLREVAFEERVEEELILRHGWDRAPGMYDAEIGLATGELAEFIGKTQQPKWDRLKELYGGETTSAQRQFALRVASEIDARGVLDVLRKGVKDRGQHFDLAYFRPGHSLAAGALDNFNQNVLTVARQLRYSARDPRKSVDLAFFVNGLPVASAELKNPNTGQDADDAIEQYRNRDPSDLFFARRALVHFAVDPDRAFVTTRLMGADTRFVPFNTGSAGPGKSGGAGNPAAKDPGAYPVSYLWEDVWDRDNWLAILQRYMHIQAESIKPNPHTAERVFPRFHQWHAVEAMVDDARRSGAGQNYLIEHSAGSGKSNTIAWLAHRLSGLFDADNQLVFHKVVVITDRDVLDKQLQKTIYQFDHTPGVVKKIEDDSAQLAAALADSTSKIIISTLQKYPFVLEKISRKGELGDRRYAVIIDEAHSSQGGDAAARLKEALGAKSAPSLNGEPPEEYYARVRGPQPNLSYFAFTATPKHSTLNLFGRPDPARAGYHAPFHVYSMRQAIDEGYILDVLANYITYQTKWRLRNLAVDQEESQTANPKVDERKARSELVRLAELHPTSVKQRAKLIVDDFRDGVSGRMGGRAKAMVVTTGRQHALDLYQAIRAYASDAGFTDCGVLIAFSGSLKDEARKLEFTESQLNGIPEAQLPKAFGYVKADDPHAAARNQREYRILVVADKYQTGFDQPLLCAMYVDKPLAGVAAVQTLSRLNRTHPRKSQDDVRILDFRNTADDIKAAFKDWFEATITEPTDPSVLYDRAREAEAFGVVWTPEMEAFIQVLAEAIPGRSTPAAERDRHARLHSHIRPALDRFAALDSDEDRDGFRRALQDFLRAYSLLAQVYDWNDADLERLYQYGQVLLRRLPGRPAGSVDIGDADLSHYRLEFTGKHNASLSQGDGASSDGVVRGHWAGGGTAAGDPDYKPLAEVIRELNERFGLDLGTRDEVFVYQQVVGLVEDDQMNQVGLMNDEEKFGQVADDKLDDIVADNAERNTEFMKRYFDNPEFQKAIKEAARKRAYRIITQPARDEALARLRAEIARETGTGERTIM